MPIGSSLPKQFGNRLLAGLSGNAFNRIKTKLVPIDLKSGQILIDAGEPITHVYFPESGLISLLATTSNSALEVAIAGRSGMVGFSAYLGAARSSCRALVQANGFAVRMNAEDFIAECITNPQLQRSVVQYGDSLITQISQSALCSRFHKVGARVARRLLIAADEMFSNEFRLTHQALAKILGVRREGVTLAARTFQDQGIIDYRRGGVAILNRGALELLSCECYSVLKGDRL
ncbi:MAG: Crp/Fnr family transcriptional regulator [Acidobacteriota bacterium]